MKMDSLKEEEEAVSELRRQLEEEDRTPGQTVSLLIGETFKALEAATASEDGSASTRVKARLYLSGVLSRCAAVLSLDPRGLQGGWSAAARLAQLTSSCCVGAEPGERSEAFHHLFLPSVVDSLLSLACRLMRRAECASLFEKVMDSVGWMLRGYAHLATRVLSSVHYEQIQMCDDVSLICVRLWIRTCASSGDFVSGLTDDSALLLLNEAVCQLAVSADAAVGGASVRLILLMAGQQGYRIHPLLLSFRGLDSILDKDWRGRGFDQEVEHLIAFVRSYEGARSYSQAPPGRERAACTIQAAWRSCQTRRRAKSLSRAVGVLQRRYRARRKRQQEEKEAQRWEEELKYQVCVRRQQARRKFHERQRRLLQLLPPDRVQPYLRECERRAAVAIQSAWRGFRERRHGDDALRRARRRRRAAVTLQRAARRFLRERRAAKAQPADPLWIGRKGLTDSRRAELKRRLDEYVALRPSSRVSREECERLHEEVQLLLLSAIQRGDRQRREEERTETLLAHTHTQLEQLRDAPPLSEVTAPDAESFLSPSAPIAARAREAHNAMLQASRLPWWRTLGAADDDAVGATHLQELEAELGGLFVGGGGGNRRSRNLLRWRE
ncbi:IQ calmodulin-binding motif-containing protein 1-like [Brachionichthys hirsutus]|uniref:IQ calmodulin-binding motif-containing protein 1-like n=1 Tax=Brachionichthys hirsutus TaxID=412623 RepID=UPI0036050CB5